MRALRFKPFKAFKSFKPSVQEPFEARRKNLSIRSIVNTLRHRLAAMAFWLLAFVSIAAANAFAQPLQKTVAMVGARSGASWPLWIAKEARLYS